jgi:aryl-alcohol dehydrogenase-like predicted oxidoreductase
MFWTPPKSIEWHTRNGFAAFAYTPQANGYFRRLEKGTLAEAPELVRALFHSTTNQRRFERVKAIQANSGYGIGEIALAYLLSQPFPVFPIVGPKKISDLEESLRAAGATLTPEQIQFLTS